MKMMCQANAAQRANRRAEIHVIARNEETATAAAKATDGGTIFSGQTATGVDSEQPQFIEIRLVDARKHAIDGTVAVTRRDSEDFRAILCLDAIQKIRQ